MKSKKKLVLFLAISALIVLGLHAWFDEDLFTEIIGGKGKSNVIFIQDCTGSMCQIVYHPDFNVTINTGIAWQTGASIDDIDKTFWYIRWYYVSGTTKRIYAPDNHAHLNLVSAPNIIRVDTNGQYIKVNDWVLQYDENDASSITKQAVGKVTGKTGPDGSNRYTLTLDASTVKGTFNVNYELSVRKDSYNASRMSARAVRLYGTNIDQGAAGYDKVGYVRPDEQDYLKWVFGVATDAQRKQVSDFCTLGHDIDYNAYLRPTPVSPDAAYALNQDNSEKSQTLLAEWNSVMKDIYPNRIANLQNNPLSSSYTTIDYFDAKDSFKNYNFGEFFIKIDAETMKVVTHTPSTDPATPNKGQLIVVRGQRDTAAAAHPYGSTIMIYNDTTLNIDESTPETHLFSSMQHVDEPTGDVQKNWTEIRNIGGTNKTCYRYKRVFTRIQVAREAICDVITAKNKLFKVADLANLTIDDTATELSYLNFNKDFNDFLVSGLFKIAPFYIQVSDPDDPDNFEIMKVTAHDAEEQKLEVTRGQKGTTACAHAHLATISTFSGARDLVRFGVFDFPHTDPQGGLTTRLYTWDSVSNQPLVPLNDFGKKNASGQYVSSAYINSTILDRVKGLSSDGTTPLAKALAAVWNYLKPNPVSDSGPGSYIQLNSGGWEAVDQNTFAANENKFEILSDGKYHPKGSPMEYYCQENYAVMITDGVSNSDSDLTNSSHGVFNNTNQKTQDATGVISEFYKFDYNNAVYGPSRWGDEVNDGSEYLTDVAYFLAHQDMFPTKRIKTDDWDYDNYIYASGTPEADPRLYNETDIEERRKWPGNQNIKTYTVGLAIANSVLAKTAKNGSGKSFTAQSYRDLSEAFTRILTSVAMAQKPMSYTTYAAPKQSITEGKYGYIAHFIPDVQRAIWQGHLRKYRLSDIGAFPTDIDDEDEEVVGHSGIKAFQWDAAKVLEARTAERLVYTSKLGGSSWPSEKINFMTSSEIGITALGVANADQVTQVKMFVKNFLMPDGITRVYPKTLEPALLGETFHFNPQLVGYPLVWKSFFDPSYKSFYERYSDDNDDETPANPTARKEVVYTGANDGKLHCFQSSTDTVTNTPGGTELWSYVPYELLKKLKIPALSPNDLGNHTYFVDGKSLVKDIKVGSSGTYTDWKTGIFFGLGRGGRAYCALDITNPLEMKVMWETLDSAETVADGRMGLTEAKPVVVDMYAGSTLGKFPAVILAGGYNAAETQATDSNVLEWQQLEGKALYILNANTGALVKKFIYGSSAEESGNASSGYIQKNPDFITAMTAAPAVFDKNNDGLADVIYFAESGDYRLTPESPLQPHGGAIWKINCYGDPADWEAKKIYQAPAGQTIYISPTLAYDENYRVWVMFGTGRRPFPAQGNGTNFTNLTGQFVAFIDNDSSTFIENANLHQAEKTDALGNVSVKTGSYTMQDGSEVKKGFYFNFLQNHEIMFEPQPLYLNDTVYFMTFTPEAGTGATGGADCSGTSQAKGSHFIYKFKLTSTGNTFVIGDFLRQSGKILGYGPIDDEFTIYVGAGEAGNFKSIESERKRDSLKDLNHELLWKEDKK